MHYDEVENYAMKCRLYPTSEQKRAIDDALTAVRVFHNCLVYDMWNNGVNLIEKVKKRKDGSLSSELVHFPDLDKAMTKEYKDLLIAQHPIIKKCPQAALTTNVGLKADLKKEFGKYPIEYQKPTYYNEWHTRLSYSYSESLSKIQPTDNPKMFRINLAMIGAVKVRGWNPKIRFENEQDNFLVWASANKSKTITVTVSRDLVGDYFIVFKIKKCLKPFAESPGTEIGIDVGIKDIAVCSDGQKFENPKTKKLEKKHQKRLNRQMSRRWGPSNEEYRAEKKKNEALRKALLNSGEQKAMDGVAEPIAPSKGYLRAKERHARLNRKIARKREVWNHQISRKIVEGNGLIAVETLNVSGMVRNKHLSYALTDAAFGSLLTEIKYKSAWHGRDVREIGKWTPSSKRCSHCGYIYNSADQYQLRPWALSIRSWNCPICGEKHDRDINAAKNILFFAKQ